MFKFNTIKHLATLQPKVPLPNNKHFWFLITSRSISGMMRHFMSFRFNETADSASFSVFMLFDMSTMRGPSWFFSLRSQPIIVVSIVESACDLLTSFSTTVNTKLFSILLTPFLYWSLKERTSIDRCESGDNLL